MLSRDFIFWAVDVQRDFMLPGGALYVPGAEKLLPNIRKLVDAARRNQVFLVSSGDFHSPDDPEFTQFPPHCVKGTPGADLLPEALANQVVRVENLRAAKLPADLNPYQQVILEKQTLDVFQSLHADELVQRLGGGEARIDPVLKGAAFRPSAGMAQKSKGALAPGELKQDLPGPEFVVFGVVTEYCVGFAVKGLLQRKRRVAVVRDAIASLAPEAGTNCLAEFQNLGVRLVSTEQALANLAG